MKKYFIGFIFGLIIAGTISVSAYTLLAKDVSYTPSWTKENGESINNVKDALDELYNKSNNILNFSLSNDNFNIEQDNIIDGTVSKSYTATKEEIIIVSLSQTGAEGYSNNVTTDGTIIKDSQDYSKNYNKGWYINTRTVVVKLNAGNALSVSSNGAGYGSGQYSITHII
jgi:hypothetical protein